MSSLVSCIVPVYNGERFLSAALDSIFAQTYERFEVIVADDGSTDATADVAKSYSKPIRYVRQTNRGPAAARNLGVGAAEGDYLAFLDADDLWHREKLSRQIARFSANPELTYCVTHILNFWEDEVSDESDRLKAHPRSSPVPGYVADTLLARRQVFEKVGGFDEQLEHGDLTDWFLRVRNSGCIGELMSDLLVYRRLHATNRSRKRASNSRAAFLEILKANLDRKRSEQ